ncbi:serine/threonine-protein kinase [Sorangium sp. So ce131]|uniref:serine/threonine-protein kinase n=1 Tax=Sorangium sp. So ce131 TaxID=3133282 RepID=UPI003F600A4A
MALGAQPAVGDLFAGKYRIEQLLGEGGMGLVFRARHIHLDEPVAIKLLRDEYMRDPLLVERFLREARAAAKIKSDYVVRVVDADTLDGGPPYLVMEYLEGHDLATLLQQSGPMAPAEAVGHVLAACDALAEAHALGIVHRDLKPANLFAARQRDGSTCTKILDFGISKLAGTAEELTRTGAVLGSPLYMAPEQMRSSRAVDHRADIWSLGAVLYKLLTDAAPFPAANLQQLGMLVLMADPVPPRQQRPDLPEDLEAVVLRCLEKPPERRFSTVLELAAALAPFAPEAAERVLSRDRPLPPEPPSGAPPRGTARPAPPTQTPLPGQGAAPRRDVTALSARGGSPGGAAPRPWFTREGAVLAAAALAAGALIALLFFVFLRR